VGDDVGVGVDNFADEVAVALEVGDEDFNQNPGMAGFDLADRFGEVAGPLVWEVIPIDARQHDVIEADFGDGLGDVCGFVGIQWLHPTGFDVTEVTASRTAIAHQHERGRAALAVSCPGPAGPAVT